MAIENGLKLNMSGWSSEVNSGIGCGYGYGCRFPFQAFNEFEIILEGQ